MKFIKKSLAFSCEFCNIFKKNFVIGHNRWLFLKQNSFVTIKWKTDLTSFTSVGSLHKTFHKCYKLSVTYSSSLLYISKS